MFKIKFKYCSQQGTALSLNHHITLLNSQQLLPSEGTTTSIYRSTAMAYYLTSACALSSIAAVLRIELMGRNYFLNKFPSTESSLVVFITFPSEIDRNDSRNL